MSETYDHPQGYQDGWATGAADAARGRFNLQNDGRGSEWDYAEGYYAAQEGERREAFARTQAKKGKR